MAIALLAGCRSHESTEATIGYHVSNGDLAIELPWVSHTTGAFGLTIKREATTAEERRLVRLAEAVYPDQRAVLKLAAEYPQRELPQQDNVQERWWYFTFDEVRIPYAITAGAVKYYIERINDLSTTEFHNPPGQEPHGEFIYRSTVERSEQFELDGRRFENVWVVTMNLHWYFYCGGLCMVDFDKGRVVVIGREDQVLAVSGDGVTQVTVS